MFCCLSHVEFEKNDFLIFILSITSIDYINCEELLNAVDPLYHILGFPLPMSGYMTHVALPNAKTPKPPAHINTTT